MDRMSRERRSAMMGRIRGRDTRPEIAVRRALHKDGYRFRIHFRGLPGTPDIAFTRRRIVIFVNGCFWHGHSCRIGYRTPKTRPEFWQDKIERNQRRDLRKIAELEERGYQAITIWECELKEIEHLMQFLRRQLGPQRSP